MHVRPSLSAMDGSWGPEGRALNSATAHTHTQYRTLPSQRYGFWLNKCTSVLHLINFQEQIWEARPRRWWWCWLWPAGLYAQNEWAIFRSMEATIGEGSPGFSSSAAHVTSHDAKCIQNILSRRGSACFFLAFVLVIYAAVLFVHIASVIMLLFHRWTSHYHLWLCLIHTQSFHQVHRCIILYRAPSSAQKGQM